MEWNWQQPDWPAFSWKPKQLLAAEERFLRGGGVLVGTMKHMGPGDRERINIDAMSLEAVTTSEIEGEMLDRASVQSSIQKQLGLATGPPDKRKTGAAEQGIAEMMVDLYRNFAEPLSAKELFRWHRMIMRGRQGLRDVGRYRTSPEPMQVVSGAFHNPRVHFEAPPSSKVPDEMARFVEWFQRTGPGGTAQLPAVTRAGVAHLYFVSIHPFEDGNGRIGRAIAEKSLAQSLDQPMVTGLAEAILTRRKEYYAELEAANKRNRIDRWLGWFAEVAAEAQRRTLERVEFVIEKTRLLDGLRGRLNARQEKVLLRMLREGPEGFKGGLSAGNYMTISGASPATATRDLADMVAQGALVREGELRHARYRVAIHGDQTG